MSRATPLLRSRHFAWVASAGILAACQSAPPSPAVPDAAKMAANAPLPPAAPASAPPARPTLVDEQRRLAALFLGTPVVFTLQSSSLLRVEVPLRFCFDRGQAALKPALVAVLDRIAQSQRDGTSRIEIATPADAPPKPRPAASGAKAKPAAPSAIAGRRADAIRDRFVAQGISADRLGVVGPDGAGVRVWVRDPPAP